jgi:hypothetical protein
MPEDVKKDEAAAVKVAADAVKPSADLVTGDGATVTEGSKMSAEPGHRLAAAAVAAGVFDPNVARRLAEGRGPGMQDSEAREPAVWTQPSDIAAAALVKLQRSGDAPKGAPELRPEVKG